MRLWAAVLCINVATAACSPTAGPAAGLPDGATPRPACEFSIVALPSRIFTTEDEPLPPGSRVIVRPDDFDVSATSVEDGSDGDPQVTLHLRGAAIDAFARHTADHTGDLIAILLNGDVLTVPMIQEQITDGEIRLSVGGLGSDRFSDRVAACAS
jgi:hypothetical protein